MKTKKPIFRLVALAALSIISGNELVAQTNLGAACGCPAVASRTVVAAITTVGTWSTMPTAAYGKELLGNQNITLTCDKIWTINEKLYIGPGSTLTIEPGTLIKGVPDPGGNVAAATAIIIERGGKIIAPGVEDCPIVFTSNLDVNLNGTYGVQNKGKWGGILLCGKATNNLTLSANGPFIPGQSGKNAVANGLGVLEGFAASIPQDQYGMLLSEPSNLYTSSNVPTGNYTYQLATVTPPGTEVANTSGQTRVSVTLGSGVSSFLFPGLAVSGTGIAANTTIASISTSSPYSSSNPRITLSLSTSGVVSGNLTFTGTYPAANPNGKYYTLTSAPGFAGGTGPVVSEGGVQVNYAAPYYATGSVGTFDDNDNSGIMTYVSIRHAGANLLVGSEINGLTLASVGRGTKIEHIEIVSCADDNIEIFGGTVNLKYCSTLFGNDDMFDYDQGWTGKAQFLFGMKANQFLVDGTTVSGISNDSDHGFEMDSDDSQSYNLPRSTPVIYNATIVGNDKIVINTDNTSLAAICAKENSGGSIYNSLFANFRNGFNMKKSLGSSSKYSKGGEAWHNWVASGSNVTTTATGTVTSSSTTLPLASTPSTTLAVGMAVSGTGVTEGTTITAIDASGAFPSLTLSANATATASTYTFSVCAPNVGNGSQILKVKCNTFLNNAITGTTPLVASFDAGTSTGTLLTGAEMTQFVTTDKNIEVTSLTGFSPAFLINGSTNAITTKNDVVPSPGVNVELGTGCAQAPMDGFFEPANYRGAFAPSVNNENWLSDWSYSQVINSTKGVQACPTDLDGDGDTDVDDFGIFAPKFGTNCN